MPVGENYLPLERNFKNQTRVIGEGLLIVAEMSLTKIFKINFYKLYNIKLVNFKDMIKFLINEQRIL